MHVNHFALFSAQLLPHSHDWWLPQCPCQERLLPKLITSTAVHNGFLLVGHPTNNLCSTNYPQQTPVQRPVKIAIKGQEVTCYGGTENSVISV